VKNLLCIVFVALPLHNAVAQDNVIDRVEWVVGDKSILRSDIEEAIRYWVTSGRTFEGDPYCVVGEDLAVQQLFLHLFGHHRQKSRICSQLHISNRIRFSM
jgi:peptidyl-prolyl cis-trans isomerase SurA